MWGISIVAEHPIRLHNPRGHRLGLQTKLKIKLSLITRLAPSLHPLLHKMPADSNFLKSLKSKTKQYVPLFPNQHQMLLCRPPANLQ